MNTIVGLRFLRALAQRGERVPAYLLPADDDTRGAAHDNQRHVSQRPSPVAHSRHIPR